MIFINLNGLRWRDELGARQGFGHFQDGLTTRIYLGVTQPVCP